MTRKIQNIIGPFSTHRLHFFIKRVINLGIRIFLSTVTVNIGNPVEFTMLELAEEVIKLKGSKSKISFLPLPSDDPKQRRPDISFAKSALDWEPEVHLDYFKKTIL